MKIKKEKIIQKFLNNEFEKNISNHIFREQKISLQLLIEQQKGKTKNQLKTLKQTILPRIALYQVLLKEYGKEKAYEYMKKYMFDVIGKKKHSSTSMMEKVPFFFYLYRKIFMKIMRSIDLQESTQKKGKNYFDITITKCLWHTACVEADCKELCHLFCDIDNITYGSLKKMGFTRTETLGYDGKCCDFHFYKK